MISEMLCDDTRQIISSRELIEYATAHVPELSSIHSYRVELPAEPPCVMVNRIKMSRALINLLENAMDAVDPVHGEITVSVLRQDASVLLEVADNGVGILPDQSELIWEPGFSTKQSSGFGLSFVKEIVEKNGGTIRMESLERCGTRMVITLPEALARD